MVRAEETRHPEFKSSILGDIKGTDKLIPIIDVKYDDFGVCYGWAGNQAIVWANPKALKEEELRKFNEEFSALPVPASLKNEAKEIAVTDEPEERGRKRYGITYLFLHRKPQAE